MRKRLEEDEEVGDSGDLWYRAAAVLYGSCKRIPPSGHLEDDDATEEETERIKLFLVISPHFRSFNFVKCNKTDNKSVLCVKYDEICYFPGRVSICSTYIYVQVTQR